MHVTKRPSNQVTNSIQVNLTNQPSNSQVAQVSKIILHLTRENDLHNWGRINQGKTHETRTSRFPPQTLRNKSPPRLQYYLCLCPWPLAFKFYVLQHISPRVRCSTHQLILRMCFFFLPKGAQELLAKATGSLRWIGRIVGLTNKAATLVSFKISGFCSDKVIATLSVFGLEPLLFGHGRLGGFKKGTNHQRGSFLEEKILMKKNPAVELKMLVPHPKKVAFFPGKSRAISRKSRIQVGEIWFRLEWLKRLDGFKELHSTSVRHLTSSGLLAVTWSMSCDAFSRCLILSNSPPGYSSMVFQCCPVPISETGRILWDVFYKTGSLKGVLFLSRSFRSNRPSSTVPFGPSENPSPRHAGCGKQDGAHHLCWYLDLS